jgi:hypothetical protein
MPVSVAGPGMRVTGAGVPGVVKVPVDGAGVPGVVKVPVDGAGVPGVVKVPVDGARAGPASSGVGAPG